MEGLDTAIASGLAATLVVAALSLAMPRVAARWLSALVAVFPRSGATLFERFRLEAEQPPSPDRTVGLFVFSLRAIWWAPRIHFAERSRNNTRGTPPSLKLFSPLAPQKSTLPPPQITTGTGREETLNASAYRAMIGPLNKSAVRVIQDAVNAPAYRVMQDALRTSTIRAIRETLDAPAYRAMQEALQTSTIRAIQETVNAPAYRAMQDTFNKSTIRLIQETVNAPAYRALQDTLNKSTSRMMQDAVNQPAFRAM